MTTTDHGISTRALLIIEATFLGLGFSDIDALAKLLCTILVILSTFMIIVINWPKFWNRVKEIKKKLKK